MAFPKIPRWPNREDWNRGAGLFVGLFLFAGAGSTALFPTWNPTGWLLDLRPLSTGLTAWVAGGLGVAILLACGTPSQFPRLRALGRWGTLLAAVGAAWNAVGVYRAQGHGVELSGFPPVSLLLGVLLLAVARLPAFPSESGWRSRLPSAIAAAVTAGVFPLLQILALGWTDYRRPASVAVVFGARTYADGRPSQALADRVRTACELHREGWVRTLVFSGGPGDGPVHETEAMRQMALELGVPSGDIRLDREGLNTRATVRNLRCQVAKGERILAVSEFYHLPRIRLAFAQEGVEVLTVPARPGHWLRRLPFRSMLREVAGFWSYFLRGPDRPQPGFPC